MKKEEIENKIEIIKEELSDNISLLNEMNHMIKRNENKKNNGIITSFIETAKNKFKKIERANELLCYQIHELKEEYFKLS